jgi:hypothetical protein
MFAWLDSDGDLVIDSIDECEGYDDNLDFDSDDIADGCDICPNDSDNDIDQDGICGDVDTCPDDSTNDMDEDGVCGGVDNCPELYNPSQSNYDNDVQGDTCDLDDDNDGVGDTNDCNPFNSQVSEYDCCGVCGGDNSSCSSCCGIPFEDDCTDDCFIDDNNTSHYHL